MCTAGLPGDLSKDVGILVIIINVFTGGIGTMIAGCMSEEECGTPILVGLLQIFLTPVFLFGWIWSIIWGVQLWKKGGKQGDYVASNNTKPTNVEEPPPPPPAAH